MKDGAIEKLIAKFEDAAEVDDEGTEFWTARDLQDLLGYSGWDSFLEVVEKAKMSCKTIGQAVAYHFADVRKMVPIGSGAEREIQDIRLTRYACYLITQNGDARKKPIAFAQTYFAIQTRRQEIQDDDIAQYTPLSKDEKRLLLSRSKSTISILPAPRWVQPLDFAIFQTFGYKGLYGGLDLAGIQRSKGLKSKQAILDHMGSTELAANLFRATQTEEKLRRDNVQDKGAANATHFEVGSRQGHESCAP